MDNKNAVEQFVEKIMNIEAPAQNLFGAGIPGMLGSSSPANQASETAGSDVLGKLKRQVITLMQKLSQHTNSQEIVKESEAIEGSLMMASTLGIITQAEADNLINELSDIVKQHAHIKSS